MQIKLIQILNSLESGGRPKGGASLDNKGIPSIGAEHLDSNGGFNFKSVKYIPEDYFNRLKSGIIEKENILIVKDGATTGKVSFVNEDFPFENASVNEHVFLLKINKAKAYPRFAFHYLKCPQGQRDIMRDFRGATVGGISRGFVDFVKFELPPLPDQLHIANLLSKAENLIAQRKESIRLLDEYLKSTFLEMFGDPASNKKRWGKLPIRELSLRFSDGPFGSNLKTEHYSNSGIQVIRLQNIGINEFVEKDISYVKSTHYENVLKKYSCFPGDVVVATMGEPNIRACIVPKHIDVAVNKADCVLFRVNQKLSNQYYISHLLNQEGFLFLATSFIHGQTRARISSGQIAKISIPVPPLELQTQFAQIVEKTESLKTQYKQSLKELEQLYGSLSQKAFRGELSVKQYV